MVSMVRPPCDEGVIRGTRADAPCPPATGPWILAAAVLGAGMVFAGGTVVTVMLPTLQAGFGADAGDAQWVVAAYALGLAALTLVGGALGDHFGRRRVYGVGLALFALASLWCALAPSIGQLIAARAAQGIGGALVLPGSLALIGASFAGEERGKAIGTWAAFATVTAGGGPILGGVLVELASWRWAFAVNLPLTAVALAILLRRVPESRDPSAARLDWRGAALATAGLGLLVAGLIASGERGLTDGFVLAAMGLGLTTLAGFVAAEARSPAPMLPLSLFRSRTFVGATLLTLALYAAGIGGTFFLPFNLIQVQGYSALQAGAAQLPFVLITFGLSRWAGGLVGRVGAKPPLVVGPLGVALGFLLFARPGVGGSYWTTFFPAMIVAGLGMAISVAPLTATVVGAVGPEHAGLASGVNNATSRLAGLLAVALVGLVVAGGFGEALDRRLAALALSPEAAAEIRAGRDDLAALAVPTGLAAAEAAAVERAVDEAFVAAFRRAMLATAGVVLAGAVAAALLIENRGQQAEGSERLDANSRQGDRRGRFATGGAQPTAD